MWNSAGKSVWLASSIAVAAVSAAPSAWATDSVCRQAMQTGIVDVLPDLDTSPTPTPRAPGWGLSWKRN